MPCDNYNYNYDGSGPFIDINQESCFRYTEASAVRPKKLNEVVTFKGQFYYRAPLELPIMSCCCGGPDNPCPGPEPQPDPPCPPTPDPCPDPEPQPCPEPDCFTGVTCNGNSYDTIDEAISNEECAGEVLVGCGTYLFPCTLRDDICIKGMGVEKTMLITSAGQTVNASISVLDVSISCVEGDGGADGVGLTIEGEDVTFKGCAFKYADMRASDLHIASTTRKLSIIDCEFAASANCAINADTFRGLLRIVSSSFNNPVVMDLTTSPNCQISAVACQMIGQISYSCLTAEFNGCVFGVGIWKKVNIYPKGDTEFVSCEFDNETDTGWKDMSRENEPVLGMRVGCGRAANVYKFNNCIFSDNNKIDKSVVFLSRTRDEEPAKVYIDGLEQDIDDSNWGIF